MSSLKEIKTRIASVKNTLKITSAMKMVASAKLHKAQTAIGNKLPYEQRLHGILSAMLRSEKFGTTLKEELGLGTSAGSRSAVVLQDVGVDDMPVKTGEERVAIVAFSSNSSLCGSFNANIIKRFTQTIELLYEKGYSDDDIDIYAAGRKISEAVRRSGMSLKKDCSDMVERPTYEKTSELASELIDRFAEGEISQVVLLYCHFASPASQPSVRENYLPLALTDYGAGDTRQTDYILEPDPISLVRDLLPKVLFLKLYTVVLDANAAEHAARTLAMQIASDNARDLIAELTLSYNKGRQQEITSEILDLIGGMADS